MKYRLVRSAPTAATLISLMLVIGTLLPATARASVFKDIWATLSGVAKAQENVVAGAGNVQTMPLLKPAMNIDPAPARGGGEITIVDKTALEPQEGPAGTIADIEKPKNGTISVYIVRPGDTLSGIAQLFKVDVNTILWANDIPKGGQIQVGQKLTILPLTSVRHTVKKGDTLASIAKAYSADATEIGTYNGVDDTTLTVGAVILVPNGEIAAPTPAPVVKVKGKIAVGAEPARSVGPQGSASQIGYYMRPLATGVHTQSIHGYNGVDLAAPIGTPILASAEGDVMVAREGGYNGGYGSYVVIQHGNGSQTLYAHQSNVIVSVGQHVVQGQVIGYVGNSGKSTGPHLHFEIRNGIRNPF